MLALIAVLLFLILYVLAPNLVNEMLALMFKLALWIGAAIAVILLCVLCVFVAQAGIEVATGGVQLNTPDPHQPAWDTEDLRTLGYLFGFGLVASAGQGLWKLAGDAYLYMRGGRKTHERIR